MALSEALLLAQAGKRVAVFERRDAIGGAWRAEEALDYRDVEVGCHVFIPSPAVTMMLSGLWGVTLTELRPAPQLILRLGGRLISETLGGTRLLALQSGWAALTHAAYSVSGRGLSRRSDLSLARQALRQTLTLGTRWLVDRRSEPKRFLYPSGGTGEMVRALHARIKAAGIDLRLSTQVDAVHLAPGGATLGIADGSTVETTNLILTRGSSINEINGLVVPKRERIRRHWVAVVDDPGPRRFSYLVFNRHPSILRVSDVTNFARTMAGDAVEPGRKILCFLVRNDLPGCGTASAENRLLDSLRLGGLMGADARLVRGGWWEDLETGRDYRVLADVFSRQHAIRVIPNVNLGIYLHDNAHRFRQDAALSAADCANAMSAADREVYDG